MTLSVKCLLCKCEDLSLILRTPEQNKQATNNKNGTWRSPQCWGDRDGEICALSAQPNGRASGKAEDLSQTQGEQHLKNNSRHYSLASTECICVHSQTCMHVHITHPPHTPTLKRYASPISTTPFSAKTTQFQQMGLQITAVMDSDFLS